MATPNRRKPAPLEPGDIIEYIGNLGHVPRKRVDPVTTAWPCGNMWGPPMTSQPRKPVVGDIVRATRDVGVVVALGDVGVVASVTRGSMTVRLFSTGGTTGDWYMPHETHTVWEYVDDARV